MKKLILLTATLALGLSFTACQDDEQLLPEPTILLTSSQALVAVEGQPFTIAPTYNYVTPTTSYQWLVGGQVVGTEPTLTYTPAQAGSCRIVLKVTNISGTATETFDLNVKENLKTVTFEEETWSALIPVGQAYGVATLIYGDGAKDYSWTDSTTGLTGGMTNAWGGTFGFAEGGTVISNYIDTNLQEHATSDYQLAIPIAGGSQHFAVVYCNATIGFAKGISHELRTIDIAPTTYQLGVAQYGSSSAAALTTAGSFLTLVITADNGKVINVDLARDGNLLKEWKTVDLSSLGAVNSLSFSMTGSDVNAWGGLNTPTYFAFDNVVVRI